MTEWISLKEALEIGRAKAGTVGAAKTKLLAALRAGEISARSDDIRHSGVFDHADSPDEHEGEVEPFTWRRSDVVWKDSSVFWPSADLLGPDDHEFYFSEKIQIRRDQVSALWPATKRAGGRPPEYSWDEALIAVAHQIGKEGRIPQQKERVIEMIATWFEENDAGVPDRKDIRKKVDKFYNTLEPDK